MPFTLNWRCTILWPKKKKIHITSYYINSCSRQKLKWRPHGRGMGLVKEFQWPELLCLFSNLITAVQWCGFWVGVMGTSGFKVVIYWWDDQNFKRSGNIEKRRFFSFLIKTDVTFCFCYSCFSSTLKERCLGLS